MKKTILFTIALLAFNLFSLAQFYVDPSTGKVGIGTLTPSQMLDVNGAVRIRSILQNNALNKVLATDSSGQVYFRDASSLLGNTWSLTGNLGTSDGTNFFGTVDNKPINLKVNSQRAGRIDNTATLLGYQAGNNQVATDPSTGGTIISTGIGFQALYSNTIGRQNVAVGDRALYFSVAGANATALGSGAMYYANNTSTQFINYNVAVGSDALRGSTTPSANTGNNNTAVGSQSMLSVTSGSFNSGFGQNTLSTLTTGNNNTALGYNANVGSSSLTNSTAIGSGAKRLRQVRFNWATLQSLKFLPGPELWQHWFPGDLKLQAEVLPWGKC